MKALILAAGYAKRLYPLTKEYPKPLLEIGKRPLIDYIMEGLETIEDIDEIFVVTNSKFISRFRKWADKLQTQKSLGLIDDLTKDILHRRGAIGDMDFAIDKKQIKDDLLVIGGDNLFDGNLNDFLSFAKANKPHPVIGVYNIKDMRKAKGYGVIKLDSKYKIIDFKEKPRIPQSTFVAMCLYYFPKEKLGLVKEYLDAKTKNPRTFKLRRKNPKCPQGQNKHDATGYYIDWLRKKDTIYGYVFDGRWYDIGHHDFYKEAKEKFK